MGLLSASVLYTGRTVYGLFTNCPRHGLSMHALRTPHRHPTDCPVYERSMWCAWNADDMSTASLWSVGEQPVGCPSAFVGCTPRIVHRLSTDCPRTAHGLSTDISWTLRSIHSLYTDCPWTPHRRRTDTPRTAHGRHSMRTPPTVNGSDRPWGVHRQPVGVPWIIRAASVDRSRIVLVQSVGSPRIVDGQSADSGWIVHGQSVRCP